MKKKKIIVCGATGNQGSAVVRSLLNDAQWQVVALSRNPSSACALQLQDLGAELLQADLMSKSSLQHAFKDAYGVFGVTQPWSQDYKRCDTDAELEQGINIVSAAKLSGVKHFVFSSVLNLYNQPTGVAHADSKLKIEQFIADQKVPYTILRCSQFMENIGSPFFPIKRRKIKGFVDADAKVPYVSCRDIGRSTGAIFSNPYQFLGQTISLIGDFISGKELADTLTQLGLGDRYTYTAAPKLLMRLFAREFYTMRVLFENTGRAPYPSVVNEALSASRDYFPEALTIHEYLKNAGYQNKALW
jgi:uncharacterized protein YbjT (DUF2867 family)